MLLTTSMLFGEGLGTNAQYIKRVSPDGYEIIKAEAVNEWGDDHSMVLFVINDQCDSSIELMELLADGGNLKIFVYVVSQWSTRGAEARNRDKLTAWIEGEDVNLYTLSVDWSMVLFEYEMQISAYSNY